MKRYVKLGVEPVFIVSYKGSHGCIVVCFGSCIQKNPNWAKGHVRLASAYIALGGHSNDACNELQRALSLDPGNSTAREMLIRELRRDHAHASRSNSANASQTSQEDYTRPDFDDSPNAMPGDSLTWSQRLQFHLGRTTAWYENQSDDIKTIFKIALFVLVLYVAFGGRFGLEGNQRPTGNYGTNNAYERYKRYGTTDRHGSSESSYPYQENRGRRREHGSSSSHRRTYSDNGDNNYHYDDNQYYGSQNRGGRGGYGGFSPMEGGWQSMFLVGGLVFAGQRMGINPFQTMMFMNMMGGRGRIRRGFGGFGGMGGFGRGMGGMGRRGHRRRGFGY